ncbi:unnamed protein product [Ectocarpus sp. 12 AP-2014]
MSQHKPSQESSDSHRLPCRGCLPDCPNYASCDGKPWRTVKTPEAH